MLLPLETEQLILWLKIFLAIFNITAIILIWRKASWGWLAGIFGIFTAASYLLIAFSSQTMFWGMAGDEKFIASIFEHQAHGRLLGDFNSLNLPLFYPPLYFVLGGLLGKLLNLNGIGIAKLMAAAVMAVSPLVFYWLQRWYWKERQFASVAIITTGLFFAVAPWDAIILKPYEFFSGTVAALVFSFMLNDLLAGKIEKKKIITFSILSAALFALFYFWHLLFIIAAILLLILPKVKRLAGIRTLAVIGGLTAAGSVWYWLPNILSFLEFGYENWQPLHFVAEDFQIFIPFLHGHVLSMAVGGLGLIGIVIFWREAYIKVLSLLLAAPYVYQLVNYLAYQVGGRPMQASKGFLFFAVPVLVISAGLVLQKAWQKWPVQQKYSSQLSILGVVIISLFSLNGFFIDQPGIKSQLAANRLKSFDQTAELNALLSIPELNKKVLLTSGMPELEARAPYYNFIAGNQHLAHPASQFNRRLEFIRALSGSASAEEFLTKIKNNQFEKIDGLFLYGDEANYYLYFWLDHYPNGGREEAVAIDKKLINRESYQVVYEKNGFILLMIK